jgi:SnoaL-like protein
MTADDRLAQLEKRIAALEDQIAIYQLLMTYGPSADSGSDDVVRASHHADAEYDSGLDVFHGAGEIGDMITSLPLHRELLATGSAHIATMPVVSVEGDRAYAACHGQLLRFDREADGYRVWRVTAVRLEFRRTADGWKIYRRANRLLDGSDASHQHFRDGLQAVGAIPDRASADGARRDAAGAPR